MENNFEKENEQLELENKVVEQVESSVEAPAEMTGDAIIDVTIESTPTPTVNAAPAKKTFPIWIIIASVAVVLALAVGAVFLLLPRSADYTFVVVDEVGNPIKGMVVKFTDGTGETKTRMSGIDGTVIFSKAQIGKNNTVLVPKAQNAMANPDITILQESYTLDEKTQSMYIIVRDEKKAAEIYGAVPDDSYAYPASVATYNIPPSSSSAYLIFHATNSGVYSMSIQSDDSAATVAYVGNPSIVQPGHIGNGEYNGKQFDLTIYDVGTPYVIEVKANNGKPVKFTIERKGDAPFNPQYSTWTPVNANESFKYYTTCKLDKLTIVTEDGDFLNYIITPVLVANGNIGFNGTYTATYTPSDENGDPIYGATPDIKNIMITDEKITIDSVEYNYSIVHGVPQLLDADKKPIEKLKFYVAGEVEDLNIADPTLSIAKGADGYYYTSDGKLVYVRIGSSSEYFNASLALMAGCIEDSGVNIGGYVYDGETFVGKYSYNDMIAAYYEYCDANGVYPLTEELAECINLHGKSAGWWDSTSPNYIFAESEYIPENAWLFLCCTAK